MHNWIDELENLARAGEPAVLVTVADIRGSAPRETGAHMLVTRRETIGSIGGGQLEYQCTARAAEMLAGRSQAGEARRYSLGANCGQCCGGVVRVRFDAVPDSGVKWLRDLSVPWRQRRPAVLVTNIDLPDTKFVAVRGDDLARLPESAARVGRSLLTDGGAATVVDGWLLEPIQKRDIAIAVFGAGHVGTAVVDLLAKIHCQVRWIDNRRDIFPHALPANVSAVAAAEPAREVAAMPPDSYYLVMTHSHPMDLDICARALMRSDRAWCGLIGSVPKRRRFERLLKKQGVSSAAIESLTCPVGIAGIESKRPVEIAFAIVAEILKVRDQRLAAHSADTFLEVAG